MSGKKKGNASPRKPRVNTTQRSGSSNEETNTDANHQPIEIFLRLRPLSKQEEKSKESTVTKIISDTQIAVRPPKSSLAHKNGDYQEHRFTFSKVLDATVTQDEFYSETVRKEVQELFENGKNCLVTAYGCSGTGKSHTIHGNKNHPGLMEHIFTDLFDQINAYKDKMESEEHENDHERKKDHMVFLSYIEIYNERIYDLLAAPAADNQRRNETTRTPLKLKFDKQMKPCVDGLREVPIRDISHAREVLLSGNQARQSGSTAVNQISSRSHALLTIKLVSMPSGLSKKKLIKNPEKYLHLRKMTVVDMAGNERSKRTLASGARMKETSNINSSLMIFRNCIEALKANQQPNRSSVTPQVVPFRESKLTTMLKEYLVGNGKTTMIVCASPCAADYDETINSLKFSSIAKEVRTVQMPVTPKGNSTAQPATRTPQEIRQLRNQVKGLQQYCLSLETRLRKEITDEFAESLSSLQEKLHCETEQEKNDLLQQTKESYNAEFTVISQMNKIYQDQVEEIFTNPKNFIDMEVDDDDSDREQNESVSEQHSALMKERDDLKQNYQKQQTRLNALQIRMQNSELENHELREQIESLENRIQYIQQAQFHDEDTSNENHYKETLHQLEGAKAAKSSLEEKIASLDDENRVLKDQLRDLQTLLSHKREELRDLRAMDSSKQLVTPSRAPMTPTPITPTRGTPRAIDRVLNMLTPKSKGIATKIPTQLQHNDSEGNLQTWQGDVNPSLSGVGVSVFFNNVQNTQTMRASTLINGAGKDEIKRQNEEQIPGVISSPSEILMTPTSNKKTTNTQAVMIPFADEELSDIEFADKFMNAAFAKAKTPQKNKTSKRGDSNAENISNGKRPCSDSFSDVPLDLDPPAKKKVRKNPAKALKPSSSKRTRTRATRSGTKTPNTHIR